LLGQTKAHFLEATLYTIMYDLYAQNRAINAIC